MTWIPLPPASQQRSKTEAQREEQAENKGGPMGLAALRALIAKLLRTLHDALPRARASDSRRCKAPLDPVLSLTVDGSSADEFSADHPLEQWCSLAAVRRLCRYGEPICCLAS